jgi:hypothetical protein
VELVLSVFQVTVCTPTFRSVVVVTAVELRAVVFLSEAAADQHVVWVVG